MICRKQVIVTLVLMTLFCGCISQRPSPSETSTISTTPHTNTSTITTPPAAIPSTAPPTTVPPTTAPPAPPKDYKVIMNDSEKNFPKLASELNELPELQGIPSESDLEALNDIYYLWKNATNPEVKEAFDLMIKGGTPSQKDFSYQVPTYNTELQILFWLAEQNEFHHNDTLAQAIAMVNGLWVTVGDDEVRKAVNKDANDLLNYFRETNEWQRERGFYLLEEYPLEAKICLVWTGGYSPFISRNHGLLFYQDKKLTIIAYRWNTIPISDLKLARKVAEDKNWIEKEANFNIEKIEKFFFFDKSPYWDTVSNEIPEAYINIDGKDVINHDLGNPSFTFNFFIKNGKTFGDCGDQTNIVNVFAKSFGISTNVIGHQKMIKGVFISHFFNIYYYPPQRNWKAYENQLYINLNRSPDTQFYIHILKLPVNQKGYLKNWIEEKVPQGNMKYSQKKTLKETEKMILIGIPTSQMKQWLLYP